MFEIPAYDTCPFCEYVAGRAVASPCDGEAIACAVVEERAETLAFVNTTQPQSGWVIVIPKRHAPTLLDLTEAEAAALMAHTHRIAKAVVAAIAPEGLNILQNNGIAGDQSVPHVHMHIIPRHIGDGTSKGPPYPPAPIVPFHERMDLAERIRACLDQ